MSDILLDALLDTLKTLPFLFIAYLLLEFLEHRASERFTTALSKAGPWGPIGGAVLGLVPQCGFSAAAANFYSGRLISAGTLIAVFLSTSDEAFPILLSQPGALPTLVRLLLVKVLAAAFWGLCADLILRRLARPRQKPDIHALCGHCGCETSGIVPAALRHTATIALFLLAVNLVLGMAISFIGADSISRFLLSGNRLQPLLAAVIGLVPNCASSVILTELHLSGALSFGSAVAGLCMGAGVGLAVLFRTNKNLRENLCLTGALFLFSTVTGMVCDLLLPL